MSLWADKIGASCFFKNNAFDTRLLRLRSADFLSVGNCCTESLGSQPVARIAARVDEGKALQTGKDRQLAEGSAAIGTKLDSPVDWIAYRQALSKVLLRAASVLRQTHKKMFGKLLRRFVTQSISGDPDEIE
jgi:hypothetical protein